MRKKPSKRPAAKSTPPPLLKSLVRGFLKLFEEDLPVSEFTGRGKFETEVPDARYYQVALEEVCGGRSPKSCRIIVKALVTPDEREKKTRITIQGKTVGHLKPGDAKSLAKQLSAAQVGPCALRVLALIEGGRRKKNGDEDPFTLRLSLPEKPSKPKKPAPEESDL